MESLNNQNFTLGGNNINSQMFSARRSFDRFIKGRKFDDELVEYSLGMPSVSNYKSGRSRFQPDLTPSTPVQSIEMKRKTTPKTLTKGKKKNTTKNHSPIKDLGRWKPLDDLALIIGVQQTNDLKTVHLGTKFSCKFTLQELQSRWYGLLYNQAVSRVAVAAMRNLHPEMIAAVQDKALWSQEEETVLSTIKSNTNPTQDTFAELLSKHSEVFYNGRTAKTLFHHWQSLRMYQLLPDQVVRCQMSFNDAEQLELTEPTDETLDKELKLQHRRNVKEIRQLENELGRWSVLVDITGMCPGEMDSQTLAVLRGRMVRYLMRSREITIGRSGKSHNVDIDLALEGPSYKISRRQATLRLRNTGEFYLSSEGKRPIFVDGKPISAGNKVRLYDNAVVEIACLRFIFSINHDLIRTIHSESVKFNKNCCF